MAKKLCKSKKSKILFGVCGGLAEYFNIDPTICRIIFVLLGLLSGSGIILYIIAALIMPNPDKYEEDFDVDNLKSANMDSKAEDDKKEQAKANRGSSNSNARSDEEFDSYFKK